MTTSKKIAFSLYSIIILVALAIGIQYLLSSDITSYHRQVIGTDWNSLAPGVQTLLLILMKGTGDAAFVCGVSMAILLLVPFRKGDNWSRWALVVVGLSCFLPMLVGAIYVVSTTGASSPWWLNAIMIVLLFLGFFLSAERK